MLIRRHDPAMQTLRPLSLPRSPAQSLRTRDNDLEPVEREDGRADDQAQDVAHEAELTRLRSRLGALEALLDEAETARTAAVEAALEQGRQEGRVAADELGEERLQALRDELAKTSRECLAGLREKGELAIEIARAAIHRILGEASPRTALAEEVVRTATAQIEGGTIVAIRVSAEDFASDEALAELTRELGGVRLERGEDLPSGGCKFELTLGTIDASLATQLASLDGELGRFVIEA